MVKDLEIISDITPIFEKELIILGYDHHVCSMIEDIRDMGAGKHGITVCSWEAAEWGRKGKNIYIISPYMLAKYLRDIDRTGVAICIMVQNIKVQNKLLREIENMGFGDIDIYTDFGIQFGVCCGLQSSYISDEYRQKKRLEYAKCEKKAYARMYVDGYKYFAFAPLHNDEIILVYQPGKVGSSSVHASIKKYAKNVLHVHYLQNVTYQDENIQKIMSLKSGKIICLVREPVSRAISYMWHMTDSNFFYDLESGLKKIEKECFANGFENFQKNWFDDQMKNIMGIDIFQYPFDREKGYQIIKSGNIELLLIKMERLSDLASEIGEFLDIKDFQLCKANMGEQRPYRFAYEEYKKVFSLPIERLESIFKDNEFVRHFYTEEECEKFIQKYQEK